jgi:hypothetical protein
MPVVNISMSSDDLRESDGEGEDYEMQDNETPHNPLTPTSTPEHDEVLPAPLTLTSIPLSMHLHIPPGPILVH